MEHLLCTDNVPNIININLITTTTLDVDSILLPVSDKETEAQRR